MTNSKAILNPQYEVEIRCHFANPDEACRIIPFLHNCLTHNMVWESSIYGREFFKSGQLLRMSKDIVDNDLTYYLGWKGCDIGTFANIREEIDEVITHGIEESQILKKLGISQQSTLYRAGIIRELTLLGHRRFMSFKGYDLLGGYEPLGVKMKLMVCKKLKRQVLVEIEKAASSIEEALVREEELREFCNLFGLHSRLVREEPPALLYTSKFSSE